MTIAQDLLKTELPPRVKLFKINLTTTNQIELLGVEYRWTPMLNNDFTPLIFGDEEYFPFPVDITGVEFNSDEAPARPQLVVSNINKLMGSLSFIYGDLVGAEVVYIETFATYLNSVNTFSLPPLTMYIAKKTFHTKSSLAYELRFPDDKERAYLPKRQMLRRDFPGLGTNKRAV